MILIIFGIYAVIAAKLQISRHYGLRGKGARIAGVVCIAFGLGFFTLLSIPLFATTRALGLPDGAGAVINFARQIAVFIAILVFLFASTAMRFAKAPPNA